MPHRRKRHALKAFNKLKAHSPLVGIFGHRQVGKTTFLESESTDYVSLDDAQAQSTAQNNPRQFLKNLKGMASAIDECQMAPALFPELKLCVQRDRRPGQFYLSGSVRFTSRKAIRESLTGRLATTELFPLVLSELTEDPLPTTIPVVLEAKSFAQLLTNNTLFSLRSDIRQKWVLKYLENGGLPGICFVRDARTRSRLINDILMTILDRDLRLVYDTPIPISRLLPLCQKIAAQPFNPINKSDLSKTLRIAPKTLDHLLHAFESIFLMRPIPIEGGGSKGKLYWLEDQLEQQHLAQGAIPLADQLIGLLYRNIRAQFEYDLGAVPTYFHYRTRGGARIPLAIRTDHGVLGLLALEKAEDLSRGQRAAIDSFLKFYNHSKVIICTLEKIRPKIIHDRILMTSIASIL